MKLGYSNMNSQSAIILTLPIFIPATQVSASSPTMSFTGLHRVRFTKWSGHAATQAATQSAVTTVPNEDRMVGGCHRGALAPDLRQDPWQFDMLFMGKNLPKGRDTPRFQ